MIHRLQASAATASEYLLDLIFASYGAYPKQWITGDDGEVVYGSVTDEPKRRFHMCIHFIMKESLKKIF